MTVRWRYLKSFVAVIMGIIFFIACFVSCQQHYHKNSTHKQVPDESIQMGKQLATTYCQSCHLLPDPSLLDTRSWQKGVLPWMGPMLGIFHYGSYTYPSEKYDMNLGENFYPSQPILNDGQWKSIIDYYTALAPDTLLAGKDDMPITMSLPLFEARMPAFKDSIPHSCLVVIDTVMLPGTILICDVNKQNIMRVNSNLQPIDSIRSSGPIVNVDFSKDAAATCNIGIITPNNGRHGTINSLQINAKKRMEYNNVPLFDSLARPVQINTVDLNKDGKEDYLVCGYGNLKGALSWMENLGNKKFERHVLREVPGAIRAYIQDYNKDGLPDIYALFAQGDESIMFFTNKGNGKFDEKKLLRFPPSYGSSYFELADFNKDGFPDIVYTCGDNADHSAVLKPYHGVYIFINDGSNNFTQKYFFHINGCYKAMARDFDNDGDLDMAAIAFFADYKNRPEEGFVYLENNGELKFKAFSLPETKLGRWLTMDAGDLDNDGKIDIVLGNFSAPAMIKSSVDFKSGPPFLFLRNVGR